MIHSQTICCPYCDGNDLQKNGKDGTGTQRWRCKNCRKYFQLTYKHKARSHGIHDKIIQMALNSIGVRDIGRVLGISKDTVVAVLKKNSTREPLLSYNRRIRPTPTT